MWLCSATRLAYTLLATVCWLTALSVSWMDTECLDDSRRSSLALWERGGGVVRDQPLVVKTRKGQATQQRELSMVRRMLVACLLTTLWLVPLLSVNASVRAKVSSQHAAARAPVPAQTSGSSGAPSTTRPAASFFFTPPSATDSHVDPAFQAYYTTHLGASQLGQPITAALPIHQGLVQFFVAVAALPCRDPSLPRRAGDPFQQLINVDKTHRVNREFLVSLLHSILASGRTAL